MYFAKKEGSREGGKLATRWQFFTAALPFFLVAVIGRLSVCSEAKSCKLDDPTVRQRRFAAIKMQILSKLRMTTPPNSSLSYPIPPEVLKRYQAVQIRHDKQRDNSLRQLNREEDEYYGKRASLMPASGVVASFPDCQDNLRQVVVFKVDPQQMHRQIIEQDLSNVYEAELQVPFHPLLERSGRSEEKDGPMVAEVHVELHDVLSRSDDNTSSVVTLMDSAVVNLRHRTSLTFHVTSALRRWIAAEQHGQTARHELQISVRLSKSTDPDILMEELIDGLRRSQSSNQSNLPIEGNILVLSYYTPPSSLTPAPKKNSRYNRPGHRSKRQILGQRFCQDPDRVGSKLCCLKELYVHFHNDLKWHWILEPQGYFANHCSGECPYLWGDDSSHSKVLGLYKNLNPSASAQPCCVAKDFDTVAVLFKDRNGNPQVEELSEMVVTSCKCR